MIHSKKNMTIEQDICRIDVKEDLLQQNERKNNWYFPQK